MPSSSELPFTYEYDEADVHVFLAGESGLPHIEDNTTLQESVKHDLE